MPAKMDSPDGLPSSVHTEIAILGSMMNEGVPGGDLSEAIEDATASLVAEDFTLHSHQLIFRAMCEMVEKGERLGYEELWTELSRRKQLDTIGGVSYLAHLTEGIPRNYSIASYVDTVREMSQKRAILNNKQIIEAMVRDGEDVLTVLTREQELADEVMRREKRGGFASFRQIYEERYESLDVFFDGSRAIGTIATGFAIDRWTNKFKPMQFIVIAARPAMGKTAWAINIACHAAISDHKRVGILSLEMSKEELMRRMLISESRIASKHFDHNSLDPAQRQRAISTMGTLLEASIFIDDTGFTTMPEIRQKAKRIQHENGLDLLIVDYLQLIEGPGENRNQEISKISRGMKMLAKELNIPVIALSQLSRKCEERGDKRPILSDLRESGSIEQDADIVAFIYREEVYNDDPAHRGKAEILLAKQRNGPIGKLKMVYQHECVRFEDEGDASRYGL